MTTVRPMRPEERDDVRDLLAEAYLPYEKEMVPAVFARYLDSVIVTDENQTLVAVDGDDTVLGTARLYLPGTAPMTPRRPVEWTDPMPADWAWVRSVAVRPAVRGTGVAPTIMAYCKGHVGDATAILLHTMDFMPAAIRLYERLGYERVPRWDFQAGRAAATSMDETFHAKAYRLTLGPE
ncbi:GNAT family N-acetyltransferase [Actinophytocola sp.]|uniref:GNAT family N-acetyltransferase n=1 Tax=Actinophytocola sp. TaxID=1872138 RepID=UPI002ED51FAE